MRIARLLMTLLLQGKIFLQVKGVVVPFYLAQLGFYVVPAEKVNKYTQNHTGFAINAVTNSKYE